jgi:hypothetical protein
MLVSAILVIVVFTVLSVTVGLLGIGTAVGVGSLL